MSKKKSGSKKRNSQEVEFLTEVINHNGRAMNDGPKKKHWTRHDIKTNVKPLKPSQEDMFEAYFQGDQIVAYGSAGTGKAQPLTANILTPDGWVSMRDISPGDIITTPTGETTTVTNIFPQGKKNIFTITFHDGSQTKCCAEHLWECWYAEKPGYKTTKHVIQTSDIMALMEDGISVRIPLIVPQETPDLEFSIDPYTMGVLLGTGCFASNRVVVATQDNSIINTLNERVLNGYKFKKIPSSNIEYCVVKNTRTTGRNQYVQLLDDMGLHGRKSDSKFIPDCYMRGSVDQRWELLQGLMDSDGTVNCNAREGRDISFCTTSKQLASQVQELVWSLGGTCTLGTRRPKYTHNTEKLHGLIVYNLQMMHSSPKQFFKLERKQTLCHSEFARGCQTLRREVNSIELTSFEEAQCIMVDDEHHLYVTDDYTVTHNTFLALYLGLLDVLDNYEQRDKIIIVRSAVPTREQGFLPGTLEEKQMHYEDPYRDALAELFHKKTTYDDMKDSHVIEFITTSFIRGLTWDNAVVIVEEVQNMTWHEINSVMTRIGHNARIIFTGDLVQTDLNRRSNDQTGMVDFIKVVEKMNDFSLIKFTTHDIVRSGFVKNWIETCEELGIVS